MSNDILVQFVPFILIFVVFYFLLIRPQQKKQKEHQEKLRNLRRNDTIVTQGGLYGTVHKIIDDNQIEIKIADGVVVKLGRQFVADVVSKTGETASDDKSPTTDGETGESTSDKPKTKRKTAKKS